MQIIAGAARNIVLETPPGLGVRPTVGRSRKALFDSLGDFSGKRVLDLFAGSGALGLEAASRGAALVVMIEIEKAHLRVIERNIGRVVRCCTSTNAKTEVNVLPCSALSPVVYRNFAPMDLIFGDPPYAESAEYFTHLVNDPVFTNAFAGAMLVWEIPDTPGAVGPFLLAGNNHFRNGAVRRFGGTDFFTGILMP